MLRLKAPGYERLLQSPVLKQPSGVECKRLGIARLFGHDVTYVTALPRNPIGEAWYLILKGKNVDTSKIIMTGERMGIYYFEAGANQKPSHVVYDRTHSAIADLSPNSLEWDQILDGAAWFHITGISPALSANAAEISHMAMKIARQKGVTISCDYNYRKNLWKYGKNAPEVMKELVALADVGIANEEDCQRALGITVEHEGWANAIESGQIDLVYYRQLCEKVLASFPNLKYQAITLRESHSANRNGWSACLHTGSEFQSAPLRCYPYRGPCGDGRRFRRIDPRIGIGMPDQEALEFATAASCLKHSIRRYELMLQDEVVQLMGGSGSDVSSGKT
jgi:2-dehydro-3-deoxygluconokinase